MLFFSLCASSAVVAQKVTSDYDKATDFSRFRSYAWVAGQAVPAVNVDLYIKMAIDEDLAKKGLHKVESKDADLLVTYNAARDADLNISSFHDPTYTATGGEPMVGNDVVVGFNGRLGRAFYHEGNSRDCDLRSPAAQGRLGSGGQGDGKGTTI